MADAADSAQIEIDREIERSVANLKQPEVTPTLECVECGNEIPKARRKAVNTNLCVACSEILAIRRSRYRT